MSILNHVVNNILGAIQQSHNTPWIQWLLRIFALSQAIKPSQWTRDYALREGDKFDFVVVGAGSAGAIVAARLSENPSTRVLLIEAGGDPPPGSVAPSLFATLAHTKYDWDYEGYLDDDVGEAHPGRKLFITRGKMLGGCSSNNYEIYSRGVPNDYEEWNSIAPGWGWNTVLHYFKKLENMTDPQVLNNPYNSFLHSNKGPVLVSRPKQNKYFEAVSDNYHKSLQEIGIERLLENNGPQIFGASNPHFTFGNGRRSSTAEAYLKPNKDRPNLFVAKFSRVIKILIDKHFKAYGVKVLLKSGKVVNVHAKLEVIISAGAIDTPKLLLLSGIGPRRELENLHIDVIADLPVGKNLQDHVSSPVYIAGSGLETALFNLLPSVELDAYPTPIQSGFFSLNHSYSFQQKPEFQLFNIHVGAAASLLVNEGCQTITNLDKQYCHSLAFSNLDRELDITQVILLHPLSRGEVRLKSKNPLHDPIIELGFFRNKEDLDALTRGIQFILRLVGTSHFRKLNGRIPKLSVTGCDMKWGTDAYWRCYVKNTVSCLFHPVGTCAMGKHGVVDKRLRVHGVYGLRIADASIMPLIPSGNTNVPTMMIGERAADLIKLDHDVSDLSYIFTLRKHKPLESKRLGPWGQGFYKSSLGWWYAQAVDDW